MVKCDKSKLCSFAPRLQNTLRMTGNVAFLQSTFGFQQLNLF